MNKAFSIIIRIVVFCIVVGLYPRELQYIAPSTFGITLVLVDNIARKLIIEINENLKEYENTI